MGGMVIKMYTANTSRAMYMVSCMVFPTYMKPREMEYLEKNRDDVVKGVKGTLLSNR